MKKLDKNKKILIIVSVLAILVRVVWFNGKSGDYLGFLEPWVNNIRSLGGIKSLKYNIGDYNVPYVFILTIISYFKCKPLIPIKIVSIIFDFICAIFGYKIVKYITKSDIKSLIIYSIILFLPTVIVNGAMWGQCDSIYTSFILISLYYLLKKKYTKSFIFLGVAFAFKLQFIFILPMYILLFFRDKKVHIYHFLLVPMVNIILCLPAIIAGRSISDTLLIYFKQTNTYKDLVLNFPNLYNLLIHDINFHIKYADLISKIGIIFTIFIFFIMWLYVLIKKVKFNNEKIINIGLWSIIVCTYFLPRMHDRYLFVGDILSVIFLICYEKKMYVTYAVNLVSVITYFYFLFSIDFISYDLIAVIYFIIILLYTKYIFKLLGDEDGNRKNCLE